MKLNHIHFAGIYATSVANLIFSHFHANWQNKHSGSLRFRLPGKTLCLRALKEPKWRTVCRLTPPTLSFLAICYPVSNLGDYFNCRDFLAPASGFQSLQFRLIENKLGIKKVWICPTSSVAHCPSSVFKQKQIIAKIVEKATDTIIRKNCRLQPTPNALTRLWLIVNHW